MSDGKPFAEVRELRPWSTEPSAVCVGDLVVSWHGCPTIARRAADALDAAAKAAVAAERERCARIVESFDNTDPDRAIAAAAAEIRGGK